jgi:DUF4097 and DUF4098 domain-containing protein YvlB
MSEKTFHTPHPIELEVAIPSGDIEIETVDADESTITVEGPAKLVDQTSVELTGGRLVVKLRHKAFGFTFGESRLRVVARVPHASTVRLATASADMQLLGRFASMQTKSASGDVRVDGDVDGDAEVSTVSGDARLGKVGGDLRAQSVSGGIRAASVGGDVTAKSVSGNVRVDAARAGTFTAQSVSGDIQVGVSAGTSVDVDAGSVSGDLTSEVALGSDEAVLGGGPLLVVRGKTVSGDFRVVRAA